MDCGESSRLVDASGLNGAALYYRIGRVPGCSMKFTPTSTRFRAVSLVAGLFVFFGCHDVDLPRSDLEIPSGGGPSTPGTTPVGQLSSINVTLSVSTVKIGQTAKATASGMDQFGRPFAPGVVTWSTNPDGLATVSDDGTVTAIAEGVVTIVASKAGVPPGSGSLTISR